MSPACSDPFTLPCHHSPSKSPSSTVTLRVTMNPQPQRNHLLQILFQVYNRGNYKCLGRSPRKLPSADWGGVMIRAGEENLCWWQTIRVQEGHSLPLPAGGGQKFAALEQNSHGKRRSICERAAGLPPHVLCFGELGWGSSNMVSSTVYPLCSPAPGTGEALGDALNAVQVESWCKAQAKRFS